MGHQPRTRLPPPQLYPKQTNERQRTLHGITKDSFISMQLSPDGAWKFAVSIGGKNDGELVMMIDARDKKVADKSKIVTDPGIIASTPLKIIRLGERLCFAKDTKFNGNYLRLYSQLFVVTLNRFINR